MFRVDTKLSSFPGGKIAQARATKAHPRLDKPAPERTGALLRPTDHAYWIGLCPLPKLLKKPTLNQAI